MLIKRVGTVIRAPARVDGSRTSVEGVEGGERMKGENSKGGEREESITEMRRRRRSVSEGGGGGGFSPISIFTQSKTPVEKDAGTVESERFGSEVWSSKPCYVEFDVNLHLFPYLAKTTIKSLHSEFFKKMVTHVGFVIEGREDEELPEQMLGCAKLVNLKREDAVDEKDFFGGQE